MATPDPKAKYGIALIPRKPPAGNTPNGTIRARVGLLEALGLTPSAAGDVKFSAPYSKRSHTRTLYPGATPITVAAATGVVTSVGRVNSLQAGESWKIVLSGKAYGIRVTNVRAEDLEEYLKTATGVKTGDYFVTAEGGTYPIKKGAPTTLQTTVPGGGSNPAPPEVAGDQSAVLVN